MKHPLWILNSALAVLLAVVLLFILLTSQQAPEKQSIRPSAAIKPTSNSAASIDIAKIYENDLFGTYKKEALQKPDMPVFTIPNPPTPKTPREPKDEPSAFLDPLKITLRGIIVIQNDDNKNVAVIADNTTGQEANYRAGDKIGDAQVIRIFGTKVVLLRSNGQQEVLYLRVKDAVLDPSYVASSDFDKAIQKITPTTYLVNPKEIGSLVENLAQFIDMLDLTSVYKAGKSVGIRIGKMEEKSFGVALGLQINDIILAVNDIPAIDSPSRYKIYNTVVNAPMESTIAVKLLRNNAETVINYTLRDFLKVKQTPQEGESPMAAAQREKDKNKIKEEQLNILKKKYQFAPTLDEIKKQERKMIKEKEVKPAEKTNPSNGEQNL